MNTSHNSSSSRMKTCAKLALLSVFGIAVIYSYTLLDASPTDSLSMWRRLRDVLGSFFSVNYTLEEAKLFNKSKEISDSYLGFLTDFRFNISSAICRHTKVDLLILVGTKPDHFDRREAYRLTWGLQDAVRAFKVKVVFLLGTTYDVTTDALVAQEAQKYGDIVRGNFVDSYHNITTRDLMGFRWAWRKCPQASYVMRTDDDVIVDIDKVYELLKDDKDIGPKCNFVACFKIWVGAPVGRDGRYAISREEYRSDTYDPFCQGWTYWANIGALRLLDMKALEIRPIWLNDAYLTGTLPTAMGWKLHLLKINYTDDPVSLKTEFKYQLGPSNDTKTILAIQKKLIHKNIAN